MFNFYQIPLTKKLLRDLNNKRIIIMALTLILAIAVCSFVSLDSIYQDLDQGKTSYYKSTHLADFIVSVKKAPLHSLNLISHLPNIKQVQARISYSMSVVLPPKTKLQKQKIYPGIAISSQQQTPQTINQIKLAKGTWFDNNNAAQGIVIQQFAAAHHIKPGDKNKGSFSWRRI